MKKISPADIVSFKAFESLFPIRVDAFYADAIHPENHFGQIYHPGASVWGHRDLVKIVLLASLRFNREQGWVLTVKDCLRPVEAQVKIANAEISKANPHWFEDPPFMSSPGKGAHPRGMAVDLAPEGIDMGTPVDCLTEEAGRYYTGFSAMILDNRKKLEAGMVKAAKDLGFHLHPLSNEWWDFRFLPEVYNLYAPISEDDLLPHQKMVGEARKIELQPDAQILKDLSDFI